MTTDSKEKHFQFKPYRPLYDEKIPWLLRDSDTIADIFKGLELCLDMVCQSAYENEMMDSINSEKMLRFCRGVCKIAIDYSNEKVDDICQYYLKD